MIFVVAEIGVNWDGDVSLVKDMMMKSKEAGCNAVKFQSFNKEIIKDHPERKRLLKSSISSDNVDIINEIANDVGIEWFSTPMYSEAVEFLDPYVRRYKIRELDGRKLLHNQSSNLIESILETGKEVYVSSAESPRGTKYFKNDQIKWLYCIPKYPTNINDIDFSNLKEFYGYSNHCPEIVVPIAATILGAKLIEIHITSDKRKNYFDNNVSFDYLELFQLVKFLHQVEKIKK